jgi:hypothetical protein
VTLTRPVAVTLAGVPLLPAFDAKGRRIDDGLRPDACGRRVDASGRASYRAGKLACLDRGPRTMHSAQLGWARDGYPVFGRRGAGGRPVATTDLDRCGGHTHSVRVAGRSRVRYHYHLLRDKPFLIACFRATPSPDWRIPAPPPTGPPPPPPPPPLPPVDPPDIGPPTSPALIPAFAPEIVDYVARCAAPQDAGRRTAFSVRRAGVVTQHNVRCLPADFPEWTTERPGTPQAGWFVLTPSIFGPLSPYVAIFDSYGVPVWWLRSSATPLDARVLADGRVAFANVILNSFGASDLNAYEIRDLDGALVRKVQTVGSPTDHHELEPLTNGNFAVLTYRQRAGVDLTPYNGPANATVVDAEIQEIDPNGAVVWTWNSKDHIGLEETGRWYDLGITASDPVAGTVYDIVHANALEQDGDGLLVSMRNTDAVYRIDRATGAIDWKLGGTPTPQQLTVAQDPYAATGLLGGQHDVRVLPDGTVTVSDNQTFRNHPPRGVRYAIDAAAGTATLLEDVRDTLIPASFCCGSARRLPGGNWVFSWGGTREVAELTPAGAPVLRLRFNAVSSYRAVPYVPSELSRDALRAGMDAQVPAP